MPEMVSITIAGFLTLGIMSFVYKDNPIYKFCESVFIGVSAGYWFVSIFYQSLLPQLTDKIGLTGELTDSALAYYRQTGSLASGQWFNLIAAGLGIMMLMRLLPKIGWISRWPLAFVIGSIAGLRLIGELQTNIMKQIKESILPLWAPQFLDGGLNLAASLGQSLTNIVLVAGILTGVIYFFFSKEHKGVFGGAAKVGIWFLMVTFGAAFGLTVMSRMSLLIGRIDFLLRDWLHLLG
ncbi:MAG: hypothetical protein ACRECJ_03290 [Limisphaerales bacterium]